MLTNDDLAKIFLAQWMREMFNEGNYISFDQLKAKAKEIGAI